MTSHTGKQVIIIHTLPNISTSKGNQAIKFSHLIANKMRNISLQKSYRKCDKETTPRPPLFKKKKASCEVKVSSQPLNTWTHRKNSTWTYHNSKIYNISGR